MLIFRLIFMVEQFPLATPLELAVPGMISKKKLQSSNDQLDCSQHSDRPKLNCFCRCPGQTGSFFGIGLQLYPCDMFSFYWQPPIYTIFVISTKKSSNIYSTFFISPHIWTDYSPATKSFLLILVFLQTKWC